MRKSNMIDYKLIAQSAPSLIISLFGLLFTGRILESGLENDSIKKYPIVLLSSCILNFKSNAELLYALYVSSIRHDARVPHKEYMRYAFDNANFVLFQSLIIGAAVGFIGIAKMIISGCNDTRAFCTVLTTSLCACTASSMLFFVLLHITVELSVYWRLNPDYIILPFVGACADFLSVKLLLVFINSLDQVTMNILYVCLVTVLLPCPIYSFFTFTSKKKMPAQSIEVLTFTYILCTFSGYLLDHYSSRYTFLASAFPVYSGLAVSIAFIYLHKKFISIETSDSDIRNVYTTLLLTSFGIILLYTLHDMNNSIMFYVLFVSFFILQVTTLLRIIDYAILYTQNLADDMSVFTLPMLSGLGDFFSTLLLIVVGKFTVK